MPHVRALRAPVPRRQALIVPPLVVVGLLAFGVALGIEPIGPSSLWLDDAWQALVVEADGPADLMLVGVTAPGFAWLLWGWLAVFGFSESAAQGLPFVLGLLAPVVFYLVTMSRLRPPAALLGAVLLVSAPMHVTYGTRVKPFTLSSVCVIALLGVGLTVVDDPRSPRRWWGLALAAIVSIAASASTAPVAAAVFGAGILAGLRTEGRSALRRIMGPAVVSAAFAVAWWLVVVRVAVTDALRRYWSHRYVSFDDGILEGLGQLATNTGALIGRFLPLQRPVVIALFVVAGILVLRRRPWSGMLVAGPFVLAVVLALLGLAPLGGGRTDVYLYPTFALLFALAADAIPDVGPGLPSLAAGSLAVAVAASVPPAAPYPEEDVRPLVSALEERVGSEEGVVVYPGGAPAFALYTSWPVELDRGGPTAKGFAVRVERAGVHVLSERDGGWDEGALRPVTEPYDRIWLVASHLGGDYGSLLASLRELGYARRSADRRPGAELSLWTREPATAGPAATTGGLHFR